MRKKHISTKYEKFIKESQETSVSENSLKSFFEEWFGVHVSEQDGVEVAELEDWTSGGVNMIIVLNPFTAEEFLSYVEDFDVDGQIELHRQDSRYKDTFTLRQSLEDFEEFHGKLKGIAEKLKESDI